MIVAMAWGKPPRQQRLDQILGGAQKSKKVVLPLGLCCQLRAVTRSMCPCSGYWSPSRCLSPTFHDIGQGIEITLDPGAKEADFRQQL